MGSCTFGEHCRHSHNILDQQPRKVLLKFGIDVGHDPKDLVRMVRFKKGGRGTDVDDTERRRKGPGRKGTGTSSDEKLQRQPAADDAKSKQYVCIFHLGGKCNYDEKCFNLHTEEPFQWQWKRQNDGKWENFISSGNLEMEKAFCDPNQNVVNVPRQDSTGKKTVGTVDFSNHENYRITFVGEITPYEIRRIGTRFVSQGWRSALTTWLWYWEDDNGKFVEYGKQSARGTESSICSKTLEEAYRSYCSKEHAEQLHFQTGRSQYEIDFKKMKQVNQSLGSERRVRRRPHFSTKEDINGRIKRQKQASTASSSVPTTWEKNVMSETEDFKLCAVDNKTDEYGDISRRFQATMPSASIVSIKRVQNVELWEDFCRKRGKMEKKNKGSSVREELLFHGTTEKVIDAICQQNFDHRLSGTRVGAKFGQGTYFHKNARYSDSYAKSDVNGRKCMFQARVLVGTYTKGKTDFRRPPSKDPSKPLEDFYDTCVDDSANPSIFVTFENNQVYPEYIITYST